LHRAAQSAGRFLLGHGVVDLVVQQLGGGVAHPQITREISIDRKSHTYTVRDDED
jgi:hypothetical protein